MHPYNVGMEGIGKRLKWSRTEAGYDTPASMAKALGTTPVTVRKPEDWFAIRAALGRYGVAIVGTYILNTPTGVRAYRIAYGGHRGLFGTWCRGFAGLCCWGSFL